ncbi:glycoside hydrolase family 11 protein [Pseudobacteroides cellulosolvens]|uniref:Endo-1,4-beta-xylanase n=1 Tax=Pseudobacteroides cellulosolvens ATCC 35603 = DSM 2933 TaxID=398512 RepID=A0A0L6JJW3_9FIRM|nr:glycoside hydrolase family 11 protein [Pseudobacteroides cellulosolvens]KNY25998.1 Endo-1,4-beta-xylanase [Pseudobacteroides cellulosolvens ATCC 35603 = DSM 2933]
MKQRMKAVFSVLMCLTIMFSLFAVDVYAGPTLTNNATGTFEGYDYEYWKDNGTGTMTLNGGGTFSCSWSNINNILFRTGKKLGSTKAWQDYGGISIDYACNYQPNGNSYMAVYGWTKDPLVEYYIIDSYGTWKPPGNNIPLKGTITVDGRTYEVYENTRTGPSIIGNTTFKQYWSICTQKRTSGVISVSKHFEEWEKKGMKMGKMYEVSMVVEGWQSQGKADMTKMNINFGTPSQNPTPTKAPTPTKVPPTPTKVPPTPTKVSPTNTKVPTNPVISADINNDGVVNMADVILLATKFNSVKGDSKFVDNYDLTRDGSINMADVLMIAVKFSKS